MPKRSADASRESSVVAKSSLPIVRVSARGVERLKSGHPWVYRSDIASADGIAPGSPVGVADTRGKFLGTALYSSSSQIAIRMIAQEAVSDLPALVAERIRDAIAYRKQIVSDTNACRVVFSEADFLPGLIVDRYNDVVSVQILTQAMDAESVRGAVVATLVEELKPAGIVERVDARIRDLEQLPPRETSLLWGKKTASVVSMNGRICMKGAVSGASMDAASTNTAPANQAATSGVNAIGGGLAPVRFHYDGLEGQKTGSFLDQRENYAAAARYAHGEALDVFCYQGGFALHLATKCSKVTGVDSSRPALEMADKNAALNHREIEWIEGNAFDLLRDYAGGTSRGGSTGRHAARKYDTVVLDPPAFAKTKRDLDKARSGYKELNLRALKMLGPGGILVTCSCSFHVSAADFMEVVADAARDAHMSLRLLESRGAAQDHPALLNVPETSYLKCLIFHVSN